MDRGEATEEFVRMVCEGYSESVGDGMFKMPSRVSGMEDAEWKQVQEWFQERTPSEKEKIDLIIREAMFSMLNTLMAQLDGVAGYHYVHDKPADFSVILNLYRDHDDASDGKPQETVEICPTRRGEDLHDILFHLAKDIRKI